MTVDINLPSSGMGIEEATVIRWLKNIGDQVQEGEIVAEVETAKATVEIEAPACGKLATIVAPVGTTVDVNAVLGTIAS
ncbi:MULTISPECIES: biotin/lipoyl-containing protein [unclassified Mesorhizobium]|uniref:biotin/lipoyl-containing protein n=1 Tax=unclassified Mesorhizobium TaxID=325217 RepID=UPI000FE3C834|nr:MULTISPECIES: biotin/lipoyl-containing protein [unclassified Mesorhizobium]RWQ13056.1 MAG: biotin attachment protein [Mesorhizobium sp.]TGQ37777.1 biotin attachment protein [Mesorhizobium sp. M4B.F.Ca.ET.214.01.1.1]TGQ59544.1 biotin attachment protein [Mesorhizobium sp. M4B.F.Ca.ET.211.01.1.1]TGU34610.1 biotin attachment protein [Mesorhizobium sp. M4B.F.Ca.ET.150.01.1.1]